MNGGNELRKINFAVFSVALLICTLPFIAVGSSDLPCDTCEPSADVRTFLYIYGFSPTNLDLLSDKTFKFIRQSSEFYAGFSVYLSETETKKVQVKSGESEVPVFVFTPKKKPDSGEGKLPVVLFLHGGGWTLGSTEVYGHVIRKLAESIPAIVVSPDYALAPEFPFPRAVDDCYAVLNWTAKNAEALGGDASKIIVTGDSGGGNLATVMALKSKEENGPKIAFQCLFYPSVNISSTASESAKCFSRGYVLTNRAMVAFRSFYLPDQKDWTNPYASPLMAKDLAGMPPALITTAGCDPLLDEGNAYAKRLSEAGVKVAYYMEPNIFHGYLGLLNKDPVLSRTAEKTLDYAASVIRENVK